MLEDLKNLHRSNNMGYGEKHSKKCTGVNMDSSINRHTNAKNICKKSFTACKVHWRKQFMSNGHSACTVMGVPTLLLLWAF